MTPLLPDSGVSRASVAHASIAPSASSVSQQAVSARGPVLLVTLDLSDSSLEALEVSLRLAKPLSSRIVMLHVLQPTYAGFFPSTSTRRPPQIQAMVSALVRLQSCVLCTLEDAEAVRCIVRQGIPEYEILRVAELVSASLIILGHRPQGLLHQLIYGSPTLDIIDCAPCPVLSVQERMT